MNTNFNSLIIAPDKVTTQYIGDGVYINVGFYPGEIIITANHHYDESRKYTDAIFLEPQVAKELLRYLKNVFNDIG